MVKAVILTTIAGLLSSRLKWPFAFACLGLLLGVEMLHLVQHKDHSPLRFMVDFAALDIVGQAAWLASLLLV